MTTYNTASASPLAPLVDETKQGSPAAQALTGVVGIILAIVLVMGQVSLATTKGIATHLHASVGHIQEGNKTMESVIERAAPSASLEDVVKGQGDTLASTRDSMKVLNGEMGEIGKTTGSLNTVVGSMEENSSSLATGVDGMNTDTGRITGMLGNLPAATERTHAQLKKISMDTTAINIELAAIGAKMRGYGLPAAKHVKGRR
jgi:hypothetical protein